jgi:subtilase family serine protease
MNPQSVSFRKTTLAALATAAFLLLTAQTFAGNHIRVRGLVQHADDSSPPPTDAECRSSLYPSPCYSPNEMRKAYGVDSLIDAGIVGEGQTIVIIDSYGTPTIGADLKAFDKAYGLPDPPSFKVLSPLGTVPFDPNNSDMVGWAFEATLDVEWAHAMAPGASIILLTSPVSETEGVQGLPEFLALEKYAVDHHLGNIISQSWGATENTLFDSAGQKLVKDFESFYKYASTQRVTVLASSGDSGSSNVELDGVTSYTFPTVGYPASSPWVTAVGGTSLYASTSGRYSYELVWNEQGGASGGGISQIFQEPDYQVASLPSSMNSQLGGKRGLPDISYNADPYTGILIYLSFLGADNAGYYAIGGTSEGSPQWAGIVADLNQYARQPLGFLNPALYSVGGLGLFQKYGHDITNGGNGLNNVAGYYAGPGWDLTTGWGTPDLSNVTKQKFDLLTPNYQ